MANKDSSKKEKAKTTNQGGNINVGGSVSGNNIIIGHNNTIIIDGKSVEFRTGWFYGHRYGDLESFTGRADELKLLDEWLANKTESLLIFNAFGGFGKSALTWHWLNNHVDKTVWSTAIWWSFYEKESGFDSFLAEALTHLGIETKDRSSRQQVNDLLDVMQKTGLLIVLDGFERLLRQYGRMDAALQEDDEDAEIDPSQRDCTYQSAETFLRGLSDKKIVSKVLMTSRLLPRVLEGKDGKLQPRCCEVNLKGFSPDDAVKYFQKEEIKATRAEIIETCSPYGYHPLSLSLLVGLINEDHEHRGDIAAVKNLEIFEDVKARRHHVLERAYESLAPERRDLLNKMSCFRGSIEYEDIKTMFILYSLKGVRRFWFRFISKLRKNLVLGVLDKSLLKLHRRGLLQYDNTKEVYSLLESSFKFVSKLNKNQVVPNLNEALLDLRKRGLLLVASSMRSANLPTVSHSDISQSNTFDMHPIVRHYAYNHFTAEKRRKEAHVQLTMYFIDAMPVTRQEVKTLEDLVPIIELYHHMVRAGNLDEAIKLFYDRLHKQMYYQFGAYQLIVELLRALFLDGDDKPPCLKDEKVQGRALNGLANSYSMSGQPRRAIPLFEVSNTLSEKTGDKKNLAIGLGNVAGMAQIYVGALRAAEYNLRRQIDLFREVANEGYEALGHQELGHTLSYRGEWEEAEENLLVAQKVLDELGMGQTNFVSVNWLYRSLRFLLIARESNNQSSVDSVQSTIECAQRALELADKTSRTFRPFPRDYVRAYWMLGAAYRSSASLHSAQNEALNKLTLAEENLSKALNLCRQINLVENEANILLDIARLRYAQGDFKDAQEKASEALVITERSGYVLQGADVNLFLAQYALEQEQDNAKAKVYAEEAKKLATCDGPPYYYKVAYEEAEAMLEKLK